MTREGLILSITTTTCKNKQQNSWRVEGGFPQTLGDSIDHPNASRVKTQHMDHGAYPKMNHDPRPSLVTVYFLIVKALQWQAPASKVKDHCQLTNTYTNHSNNKVIAVKKITSNLFIYLLVENAEQPHRSMVTYRLCK